jgi:hypothetical protein
MKCPSCFRIKKKIAEIEKMPPNYFDIWNIMMGYTEKTDSEEKKLIPKNNNDESSHRDKY